MTSLYSILNREAKAWWWHRELRSSGKGDEARKLERRSVRDMVETIRSAVLFHVGGAGFSVECASRMHVGYNTRSTLQGYGDGAAYSEALDRVRGDIPRVDTRTVPEKFRVQLVLRSPMPALDRQPDPPYDTGRWGGSLRAPIPIYLAVAESMGATVHWGAYAGERDTAMDTAGPTIAYVKAP